MSEPPAENTKRPDMNVVDFTLRLEEAFAKNQVSEKCPFCANEIWQIETFPNSQPVVPMMAPNGGVPLAMIQTVALSCTKCGFIRLHGKSQIDQLLGTLNDE
jgi:hypothetical protein